MLNKSEITRLLKSQEEREQALKRQLKWYFWNLKQYRNGSWICMKCSMINPKDTTGVSSYKEDKCHYTCTSCFYIYTVGKTSEKFVHKKKNIAINKVDSLSTGK